MRNIPIATRNLLIINTIVFFATYLLGMRGIELEKWGGLHFFLASDFHIYQFITYQFMHGSFSHVFWNMFALWMFGIVMENVWGPKKFIVYYLVCGIGAGICQEIVQYIQYASEGLAAYQYVSVNGVSITVDSYLNKMLTIGASGAVYGILLAFGMTFPNERIMLLIPPIPFKAKWFVVFYAVIELVFAMTSSGDGVAHIAHLGGMFFGFLLIRYWRRHPGNDIGLGASSDFFSSMKDRYEQHRRQQAEEKRRETMHVSPGGATRQDDMDWNARRKATQEEIDAMLDKIRKSGYDSLTKEEKKRLFEASHDL